MAGPAAGFWSYVKKDDEADRGRILNLAEDLRDQYRILTAEELELFVDRDSIQWGDAWEQRISDAIAGTTFFMPVITPSYFRSNSCRQEFLKFVREAERLGLEQLLMSVYWVSVPELDANPEDSGDEAIRMVSKYQWQDFRKERFEERDSSPYRRAVAALAAEIAKRASGAEAVNDAVPTVPVALARSEGENGDDGPGLMELMALAEDAMARSTNLLGEIAKDVEIVGTKVNDIGKKLDAAAQRGQGMKAALVVTERLAQELEEPASRIEADGREYAKALAELDPGIHAWLDLIATQESRDEELAQRLQELQDLAAVSDEALSSLESLVAGVKTMSGLSRSLRAPGGKMARGLQGVLDGRAIISEWGRRAEEIRTSDASSG